MSAITSTARPQVSTGWGSGLVALMRKRMRQYRTYKRTVTELQSLSQRELDDLGISRCMISRLANEAAQQE